MATLHYLFDPFCGWCYAAAPLVEAARGVQGLEIILHAGGLMSGMNRKPITPRFREFVLQNDRRIAQLSGQPFGEAYTHGLLQDETAVLDSTPPITAILAAEQQQQHGLALLRRLQQAHFMEGRRISEEPVLLEMALDIGLTRERFEADFLRFKGPATEVHIAASRGLLERLGGRGFPTFAVVRDNDLQLLEFSGYLGRPEAWAQVLTAL